MDKVADGHFDRAAGNAQGLFALKAAAGLCLGHFLGVAKRNFFKVGAAHLPGGAGTIAKFLAEIIKTALLTFIPPMMGGLVKPDGFLYAIGYAGLAATIWAAIVPALLAAAVVFLLLFFWQWTSYQKSDEEYQTLRTQLVWMDTSTGGDNAPASRLDFTALKEQNPDVTAWLSVQGLELSLPVVQNEDSNYYLRRSFSGGSSNDGCLIRPSWDSTSWADGLCHVIHGHNIHNGAMFGKLDAYRKQDFYSANPTFTLYTPDGDYLCRDRKSTRLHSSHT